MKTPGLLLAASLLSTASLAAPISWKDVIATPQPPAGERIAYGPAPQQFGELRMPLAKAGAKRKVPVAVLIHGGCWLAEYDYRYFNPLAAALAAQGIATWTIEYRRLGDTDGGWPHTLLDVAKATDHLREIAKTHALDTKRVVSIGHSAGGQLALWLAARPQLKKSSALYQPKPLALRGVVGLAAITDLHRYRIGEPGSCNSSVDQLMGGTPDQQPTRYAEASPRALLPLGVAQWLIQGGKDPIVPAAAVADYIAAAKSAGDVVSISEDAELGHFDPAVPQTRLGAAAIAAARQLLGLLPL